MMGDCCNEEKLGGVKFGSQEPVRHGFRATLKDDAVEVVDSDGKIVEARLGGTPDNRTCYAFVRDVGFIGGWRYPHRRMPRSHLVECINRGIIYQDIQSLPTST